jgi:hypothetical protein
MYPNLWVSYQGGSSLDELWHEGHIFVTTLVTQNSLKTVLKSEQMWSISLLISLHVLHYFFL